MNRTILPVNKCKEKLGRLLIKVQEAYAISKVANPINNQPKRCEGVLLKQMGETYEFFTKTKNPAYKEIYNQTLKKYNGIINKKNLKPYKLLKLADIERDSTFIHPEEMEEDVLIWKKAMQIRD